MARGVAGNLHINWFVNPGKGGEPAASLLLNRFQLLVGPKQQSVYLEGAGLKTKLRHDYKNTSSAGGKRQAKPRAPGPSGQLELASSHVTKHGFCLASFSFQTICHVAVGQNQWYHFGVGAPPILVYVSGDWDVLWGYGILTHGHVPSGGRKENLETTQFSGSLQTIHVQPAPKRRLWETCGALICYTRFRLALDQTVQSLDIFIIAWFVLPEPFNLYSPSYHLQPGENV